MGRLIVYRVCQRVTTLVLAYHYIFNTASYYKQPYIAERYVDGYLYKTHQVFAPTTNYPASSFDRAAI